jgi:membrane associated rhomboid family serine protease
MSAWPPSWSPSSRDYEPITYYRGIAVDATLILALVHIGAMIGAALLLATGLGGVLQHLVLQQESLSSWQVWKLVLYPFYHDIRYEHIWFAVQMLMFFWFGREVERFMGRTNYCILYASMVAVPPLLMLVLEPLVGPFGNLAGSRILHFGVFCCFVVIYPHVQFFFTLKAKWIAWALLGIFTLINLSNHDWPGMAQLWGTVATGWVALKAMGVSGGFHWIYEWQQKREARQLEARRERLQKAEEAFHEDVDAILEKISREGIHSLTRAEKKHLEKARARLLEEDRKG